MDVNSKDKLGHTPLSLATIRDHEGVVKLLVETGNVDVNSKDNRGRTALFWAITKRYR